jgi:hypothetical protein
LMIIVIWNMDKIHGLKTIEKYLTQKELI